MYIQVFISDVAFDVMLFFKGQKQELLIDDRDRKMFYSI